MFRILLATVLMSAGAPVIPVDVTPSKVAIANFGTSLRVYVRGTDGRIWYRPVNSSGMPLGGWLPSSGRVSSGPDASTYASGTVQVLVARSLRNSLVYRNVTPTSAGPWVDLGGTITTAPSVVIGYDNRTVAISARGTDGGAHVRIFRDGRWLAWRSLGGSIGAAPDVAQPEALVTDPRGFVVSVRAADGRLYFRYLDFGGVPQGGWVSFDMVPVNSNLQHFPAHPIRFHFRGTDNTLSRLEIGRPVTSLGGVLTSGPDADNPGGPPAGEHPDLYVARGTDNALWILDTRTRAWRSLGGVVT